MKNHAFLLSIIASMLLTGCQLSSSSVISSSSNSNNSGISSSSTIEIDKTQKYQIGDATSSITIQEIEKYYYDVDEYFDGNDFLTQLRMLNENKLKNRVGYNSMWSYYGKTDYYSTPFNGTSGKFIAYYNGGASSKTDMNREHVWPASRTVLGRGEDPLEDDIHMVRPTLSSDNSSRGNALFAEQGAWDPGSLGQKQYRGDVARIVFYCVITNEQYGLLDVADTPSANHMMGKLSDLLKWNLEYPVSQSEMNRNDGIFLETPQNNRNPFIDHPSYACKIWGNTNESTRSICGIN